MQKFYSQVALVYFVAATIILMLLAFLLLGAAVWEAVVNLAAGDRVAAALDSIGILIIGFAVIETAKFIAEEEIVRKRELRSSTESRRSITKFITIIVIAASLEALVMVFKTSSEGIQFAVYPAFLFMAAMFALVALGAYQWLSSRIETNSGDDDKDQPVAASRARKRRE
ncbi:hypothetical protein L598_003500000240 [Mesorhizobium sp. J18]|uniref:GNAT family acetyltransferase n=1 Tax=Mesorhizobium sp. J18 TaxID=935263 RepID=UPI00119A2CF6|nr:GNAT family acetyltransferase [Mesorhizobium sp. J18]TWG94683.1 hypothetical protein L598_003500000240 [Mesorhizobium sp. J18]